MFAQIAKVGWRWGGRGTLKERKLYQGSGVKKAFIVKSNEEDLQVILAGGVMLAGGNREEGAGGPMG